MSLGDKRYIALVAVAASVMLGNLWLGALSTRANWPLIDADEVGFHVLWLLTLTPATFAGLWGFYRSLMTNEMARGPLAVFSVLSLVSFGAGGATLNVFPLAVTFGLRFGAGTISLNLVGLVMLGLLYRDRLRY